MEAPRSRLHASRTTLRPAGLTYNGRPNVARGLVSPIHRFRGAPARKTRSENPRPFSNGYPPASIARAGYLFRATRMETDPRI